MNRYPVKTMLDGQIVRNCRLVAKPGLPTRLWRWDKEAGAAVILYESVETPERIGATERWQVGPFAVEPQRGCGCQHPMYTFTPPVAAPQ